MQTGWKDPTDKLVSPSVYCPPEPVFVLALRDDVEEIKTTDLTGVTQQLNTMSEQMMNITANVNLINADYPPRITALETLTATHTTNINSLQGDITAIEGNIQDVIDTTNADMVTLQSNIDTKASSSDLTALTTRVSTNESAIVGLGTSKASQTQVTNIDGRLTTVENTLPNKADGAEVTLLSGRVDTIDSQVSSNTTAIGTKAAASDLTALTTRVTTVEGKVKKWRCKLSYTADQTLTYTATGNQMFLTPAFQNILGDSTSTAQWNNTTRAWTVPTGTNGWTRVACNLFRKGVPSGISDLSIVIRKNGTDYTRITDVPNYAPSTAWSSWFGADLVQCVAGDTIQVYVMISATSANSLTLGQASSPGFYVTFEDV